MTGGGGVLEHGVVLEVWGLSAILPLPVCGASASSSCQVVPQEGCFFFPFWCYWWVERSVLGRGGGGTAPASPPGSASGCHGRFFCGNRFVLNLLIHLHIVPY